MAKYLRLILVGCLVGFGTTLLVNALKSNPISCGTAYRQDATVRTSTDALEVEVVKSVEARDKGLGGRTCIGSNQGMLFVFDKPDLYPFWMKDMKFSIDIVWINDNKIVVGVEHDVSPSTYPKTFTSKTPAKYVLELQAGKARQLNITEGTSLNFKI